MQALSFLCHSLPFVLRLFVFFILTGDCHTHRSSSSLAWRGNQASPGFQQIPAGWPPWTPWTYQSICKKPVFFMVNKRFCCCCFLFQAPSEKSLALPEFVPPPPRRLQPHVRTATRVWNPDLPLTCLFSVPLIRYFVLFLFHHIGFVNLVPAFQTIYVCRAVGLPF